MTKLSPLASVSETRAVLEAHGLSTKYSLGQNFLINDAILQKIVALADLAPDDYVLEVGPGIGTLTVALLKSADACCRWSATPTCPPCWSRRWPPGPTDSPCSTKTRLIYVPLISNQRNHSTLRLPVVPDLAARLKARVPKYAAPSPSPRSRAPRKPSLT